MNSNSCLSPVHSIEGCGILHTSSGSRGGTLDFLISDSCISSEHSIEGYSMLYPAAERDAPTPHSIHTSTHTHTHNTNTYAYL